MSIEDVQSRAQALPEHGVPPEMIKLLPLDKLLDAIQIPKSATPIATPQNEEEAAANLAVTRTNGVVLEKSSQDEIDVNAQCNAALHNLLRQLKTSPETIPLAQWKAERLEMKTGNDMLDQFQPYYFGVAFSFIFSFCTAMPDPPTFMRRPRHRRDADAPRVEIADWVRIMSRRCEAALQKDMSFGFVSLNCYLRAAVNLSRTTYAYERNMDKTLVLRRHQLN